eukprot:CAMPEP_0113935528 /NCGR_PEP_ID=MMETSP1339-20121228/2674_1 /TAXON_ID=94617 /ORGANISM="Fibrocapsa japonica" /LENGTH=326 /DNA_ID=CAMNT_0000937723 /DNA_START=121 /DNA_END=1101 /DNA_ORIENTATION=+ /assembly_acc=CAM_ASM_000762
MASVDSVSDNDALGPFETPEGLKKLATFLLKESPVRHGVQMEKRVLYFKGEKVIKFLLENREKERPPVKTEADAIRLCRGLMREGFFHRSERVPGEKGILRICRTPGFDQTGYYTWIYQGNQTKSHLMTAALIVGFLLITCFPIWPQFLKVWLWYISVTLLIFMLLFIFVRAVMFLVMWVLGYDFWFLPRLFDDTLSFTESFVPVYTFEKSPGGQGYYRAAVLIGLGALFYWAYTQPTEFDSLIQAQKQFVDDLYEGNLLADQSQQAKDDIDKVKVPTVEELLRMEEEEHLAQMDLEEDEMVDQFMEEMLAKADEEEDTYDEYGEE